MFIFLLFLFLSNFASAQTKIDSLEKLLSKTEKNAKADLLINISSEYLKIGDDIKSEKFFKEAFELSEKIGYKVGSLLSEENKADLYVFRQQFEAAESLYNSLVDEFRRLNDKENEGIILNSIGLLKIRKSDYLNALKYYQDALVLFEKAGYIRGLAICYGNIGNIYENFGDYSKALDLYMKQLEISESINDREALGVANVNIGDIQRSMDNFEMALEYYTKSLKIFEEINDLEGIGILHINIGEIDITRKDFINSQKHFEIAMEILERIGNKGGVAYIHNRLGFIDRQNREYKKALEHFQEALQIGEESEERDEIANTYFELGGYYTDLNSYPQAILSFSKSLEIVKETMSLELTRDNYKGLSDLYYKKGDLKNAYDYLILFNQAQDSLSNKSNVKKLNDLNIRSSLVNKENEIELLKKESEVKDLKINRQWIFITGSIILVLLLSIIAVISIKKSNFEKKINTVLEDNKRELLLSNSSKDKMLSVISHDLRGPMGNILTALNILSDDYSGLNIKDKGKMLRQIKSSTQTTYELLENLLNWANSQSDKIDFVPGLYSIEPFIKETIKLYITNAEVKSIKIVSQTSEEHSAYFDKNMLKVILRNLISNAIKFSEKNSDVIIKTEYENEFLKVSIADKGDGIDKDFVYKIIQNKRTNISNGIHGNMGAGLGLILCKEFTEKNGGKLTADNIDGNRTVFSFTLPKNKIQS
jgi:signal transduction histidine kinase